MRSFQANTENAAWRVVDGEAVIVHAETSAYYGLNSTATFIWQSILDHGLSADEIGNRLSARFQIQPEEVLADVESFLAQLSTESLVRESTHSGNGADVTFGSANHPDEPYEPPKIERFGELEQLVLSGE
jgi:hypothetical protein